MPNGREMLAKIRELRGFAFARQAGSSWALTLAPRTTAAVAAARGPLGARAQWADTAVVLPADAPSRWTNLFTGVDLVAQTQPGGQALDISQSLDDFRSLCCSPKRKSAQE